MSAKGTRTGIYKECKECNKKIYVHKCHIDIRFFCSKDCYTKSQIGGKLSPNARRVAIETLNKWKLKRIQSLPKGERNYQWKGDNVGYRGLHYWIERQLGKASKCNKCYNSSKRYHWHNISGEYTRELSDWESLCAKCHKKEHKQGAVK